MTTLRTYVPLSLDPLTSRFANGTLLAPGALAKTGSLVDLARALFGLCGGERCAPLSLAAKLSEEIGDASTYVLCLVDGLGYDLVEHLPPSSFLRSHLARPLWSVFPPTTAAGLMSLATGAFPAQHAVPGWYLYLHEIDAVVRPLPFDERSTGRPLGELGLRSEALFTMPSLFQRYRPKVIGLMPRHIANSVFTSFLLGPAAARGYDRLDLAFEWLRAEVVLPAREPRFFYFYIPDIDAMSHEKGKWHPDVSRHLLAIDELFARMWERTQGRTRFIVTADHGFRDVPPQRRFGLYRETRLLGRLQHPAAGDSRVGFFHVKGDQLEAFSVEFARAFGDQFALISLPQAEDLRLFGPAPVSPLLRLRVGNVLAISLDDAIFEYVDRQKPQPSAHSGLSPEEMRIPLVVA